MGNSFRVTGGSKFKWNQKFILSRNLGSECLMLLAVPGFSQTGG